MKMTTQLSVSSVILAAVLSGCSQQVIGSSQVVNGSSQTSGGSQVADSSQASSSSQVSGSQQQIESAAPAVAPIVKATPTPVVVKRAKPVIKRAPVRVYNKPKQVRRVAQKPRMTRSIVRRGNGLPAAKPGQCFAKIKAPAKYQTKSRRVLIQKASSKRVLVRAPQYRTVTKKVLVRKASYINRTIPAQYRNQTKRVLVKPAYNTWKKGHGAITRIDNMTGEIMCRVTIPAQYKTVTQRVLVRKAQTVRKFVPAVYKTVKQKQRVSGALYKTVNRPARYKTQNYRVKVAGARYVWRPVLCATNAPKNYKKHYHNARKAKVMHKPVKRVVRPHYKRPASSGASGVSYQQYLAVMNAPLKKKASKKRHSVKKKSMAKPVVKKPMMKEAPKTDAPKMDAPKMEAPQTEVKTDAAKMEAPKVEKAATAEKPSKDAIQKNIVYGIQAALKAKGYNPGKLDGKMGANTAAALKAFQSSRGLPVGVLSKDTFRALGLVR